MAQLAGCLIVVGLFWTVGADDPCTALPCTFDVKEQIPFCNWKAEASADGSAWKNGEDIKVFNHLTMPVRDADRTNVNMTRGHAEAAGKSVARINDLALASPDFDTPDGNTEFHFKYYLAAFGASLKLCVDNAQCSCPGNDCLFQAKFAAKPEETDGPLQKWRPCKKGTAARQWDCSNKQTETVKLPQGRHKLYFVASGVNEFSSVAVDSFTVVPPGGRVCSAVPAPPAAPTACYSPAKSTSFSETALDTGIKDKNWDNTVPGCQLLCTANPDCKSVTVNGDQECILFASSCSEKADHCTTEGNSPQYFEKIPCPVFRRRLAA